MWERKGCRRTSAAIDVGPSYVLMCSSVSSEQASSELNQRVSPDGASERGTCTR